MAMNVQSEETIDKTAIDYLLSQNRSFEVSLLLRAGTRLHNPDPYNEFNYTLTLFVPADMLAFYRNALTDERKEVIGVAYAEALLGLGRGVSGGRVHIWAALAPSKPYPGWQEAVDSYIRGDNDPLNQGVVATASALFTWNGLRFRSRTECVVAEALSKAGVLFFPLPAAMSGMRKLEPDFLVCVDGKWGILEVHGEPFHTPETATRESERRRWFLQRGVKVMEFYDAGRCYKDPHGVVQGFVSLLRRS